MDHIRAQIPSVKLNTNGGSIVFGWWCVWPGIVGMQIGMDRETCADRNGTEIDQGNFEQYESIPLAE